MNGNFENTTMSDLLCSDHKRFNKKYKLIVE